MAPVYVALDLETTGLNPGSCEIIEVGAVRFSLEGELESFHTFVRPRGPVPLFIHRLTGISAEDLRRAPSFREISGGLAAFIGDSPIVAHNASFDLSFLAAYGVSPPGAVYDTYDLASLLLGEANEFSLQSVAQHIQIDFPVRHRALADARAAAEVFLRLRSRLAQQPAPVLVELQRLARAFGWSLSSLLDEVLQEAPALGDSGPGAGPAFAPLGRPPPPLVATASAQPVDPAEAQAVLESPERQPDVFPGYERRPEQLAMARSVAETLVEGGYLVVEAGTGTGKSLAYLAPAALYALRNGARVVISTDTISLQEQLMEKDIPLLERLLDVWEGEGREQLRYCQLKGRRNYLCPRRFAAFLSAPRDLQEAKLAARILLWLSRTSTGDRAELKLSPQQEPLWARVAADSDECVGLPCEHLRWGTCFLQHARKQAEASHLVVVNHALLLSDVATGGHVLPRYDHLIIDEAHNLEDEATQQFGFEASESDISAFFERIGGHSRTRSSGLVAGLLHAMRSLQSAPQPPQRLVERLSAASQEGRRALRPLFDALAEFVSAHAAREGDYDQRLLLTRASRAQPGWTAVEVAWERLEDAFRQAMEALAVAAQTLSENGGGPLQEELLLETLGLLEDAHSLRRGVAAVLSGADADAITWLSLDRASGRIVLSSAPLEVADILQNALFAKKESVVLSGATLSVGGRVDYLCRRIGMEGAREVLLGSPFDYKRSTLMLLPSNMPEPNENAYQPLLEQALIDLCRASSGRALVLFTSHGALQTTYQAIKAPLEDDDVLVLGQGIDGAPKNLLNALREDHRTVILGTASFWEGVDVVGEALSLLVIARLPFSVPTDPVFASRAELFDDPFTQYALPQAVLRFKQGFGRLIRRKTDRGVVAVLDRRIQSKAYGRAFLESLPPCTVREEPLRALPQAVREWLNGPLALS